MSSWQDLCVYILWDPNIITEDVTSSQWRYFPICFTPLRSGHLPFFHLRLLQGVVYLLDSLSPYFPALQKKLWTVMRVSLDSCLNSIFYFPLVLIRLFYFSHLSSHLCRINITWSLLTFHTKKQNQRFQHRKKCIELGKNSRRVIEMLRIFWSYMEKMVNKYVFLKHLTNRDLRNKNNALEKWKWTCCYDNSEGSKNEHFDLSWQRGSTNFP